MNKPIKLERSFAMDDSCQMMFWAKGHHSWGDFIAAVEAELQAEERVDIPAWVICQAPVKQTYQRSVPCSGNIVADRQFIYQDEPGRGATAVTVMNFWYPIHADRNRRAQPAEEVQPVGEVFDEFVGCGIRIAVARWYAQGPAAGTKLYTRPPAADAETVRKAARYDWLRHSKTEDVDLYIEKIGAWKNYQGDFLDAAIDAALAASKEKKE